MSKPNNPLTIALPKGRLLDSVVSHLSDRGMDISFGSRKLSTVDSTGRLKIYKVKNHDLPTYVHHGIAGLGIVGDDTVAESGLSFTRILTLPFGGTRLCVAAPIGTVSPEIPEGTVRVATSYVRMTREWFHHQGIPVKIIRLGGSVELAPVLGLAPYIVDLVETGNTLVANGLEVLIDMAEIRVRLIANTAYFKLHYREIGELADIMMREK
ncbi:MAG: ATP phosphoribosyltransferase [Spirochaetaceae bacterium]|nr:ATP phosphoribosyltransferase [Spirochaetaceae bacterium]